MTKLRNDHQNVSGQFEKAIRLLERETGEVVDIDALSRAESQWKGRAQKIEILKSKVKKFKLQAGVSDMNSDTLSVISEMPGTGMGLPSVFGGKITHAERNLTKMDAGRKNEMETLRKCAMQ